MIDDAKSLRRYILAARPPISAFMALCPLAGRKVFHQATVVMLERPYLHHLWAGKCRCCRMFYRYRLGNADFRFWFCGASSRWLDLWRFNGGFGLCRAFLPVGGYLACVDPVQMPLAPGYERNLPLGGFSGGRFLVFWSGFCPDPLDNNPAHKVIKIFPTHPGNFIIYVDIVDFLHDIVVVSY